jgi:hypothetical protein
MFNRASKYWYTLRHLKAVQFYGRVWFRFYRPRTATLIRDAHVRLPLGAWQIPAGREASMLSGSAFRFLNRTYELPACGGWNGNRPIEPQALEVEFFPMEEVLHEKVKIH